MSCPLERHTLKALAVEYYGVWPFKLATRVWFSPSAPPAPTLIDKQRRWWSGPSDRLHSTVFGVPVVGIQTSQGAPSQIHRSSGGKSILSVKANASLVTGAQELRGGSARAWDPAEKGISRGLPAGWSDIWGCAMELASQLGLSFPPPKADHICQVDFPHDSSMCCTVLLPLAAYLE